MTPARDPYSHLRLGASDDTLEVTTSAEGNRAAAALAGQARASVDIVTRDLDPALYDEPDFLEGLRRLATGSRRARIRILVRDPLPAVRRGHRLLALAARLPSYISLRVPATQHQSYNKAFLVADGQGYLYRELADRFEGVARFNDPAQARMLLRDFDDMWEVARLDPNLRQMLV